VVEVVGGLDADTAAAELLELAELANVGIPRIEIADHGGGRKRLLGDGAVGGDGRTGR
jgi:hypothetical protein